MSYIIQPSGVQNPLTADLDAGDFNISDVGTITVSVVDPATTDGITIAGASDKIGFFGADEVVQQTQMPTIVLPPLPPTYDQGALNGSFDALKQACEALNGILVNLGLAA